MGTGDISNVWWWRREAKDGQGKRGPMSEKDESGSENETASSLSALCISCCTCLSIFSFLAAMTQRGEERNMERERQRNSRWMASGPGKLNKWTKRKEMDSSRLILSSCIWTNRLNPSMDFFFSVRDEGQKIGNSLETQGRDKWQTASDWPCQLGCVDCVHNAACVCVCVCVCTSLLWCESERVCYNNVHA